MAAPSEPTHPRLAGFHIVPQQTFWTLRDTPLVADIYVPKSLPANSSPPVIVNFHGGGLVTGSRDLIDWWAQYSIDLAIAENAIIISPDYPLTPEAKSPEIVAGIKQFFTWLLDENGAQKALDSDATASKLNLTPAIDKLLVFGESAGGWVQLHAGLLYPDQIKAMVMRFPMIDLASDWFQTTRINDNLTGLAGMLKAFNPPESLVDDHIASMKPGAVRLRGGVTPEWSVADAAVLHGRVPGMLGVESSETYPMRAIERPGARLPQKIWLLHGKEDSVVPVAGSEVMERLVKENVKGTELKFDVGTGDHGFDGAMPLTEASFPIKERLEWLKTSWLQ